MAIKTVVLPAVRDDRAGDIFLIKIAAKIVKNPYDMYYFDFKNCSLLNQNAIAVLGGLFNYLHCRNSLFRKAIPSVSDLLISAFNPQKPGIIFDTLRSSVLEHLKQCHLLDYYSENKHNGNVKSDYIGYRRHDKILDDDEIAMHLRDHWLTDEKLSMSSDLKGQIVSKIFEIFMNAYGHGLHENPYSLSVNSCGQFHEKEGKLSLTVLDFGKGIINSVKRHVGMSTSDRSAMVWALSQGNSTRTDSALDVPRGLGFGILKDFVSINNGSLKIYSNRCCAWLNASGEYEVEELRYDFPGTMVTVTINCDNRYYKFRSPTTSVKNYF